MNDLTNKTNTTDKTNDTNIPNATSITNTTRAITDNIFKTQTISEFNALLENNPVLKLAYSQLSLNSDLGQRFQDYMCGVKTLPLTYDPFFKKIFDVHEHPERLSSLISSIIGKKVIVKEVLNSEHRIFKDSPLLVMDILVELEDGSYSNVEIQKIGYYFSGQRISCYISDLVQRQYALVKAKKKNNFSYRDLKPVYIIVLIEKTTKEYHSPELNNAYIHHGMVTFDTHLKIDMLENVHIAALDIFSKTVYHKIIKSVQENKALSDIKIPSNMETLGVDTLQNPTLFSELHMWLSLLCTETVENAIKLIKIFPDLKEVFMDMQEYTTKPEEALNSFSEALRILDINTVNYMVDDMKAEIEAQKAEVAMQKAEVEEKKAEIETKDAIIRELNAAKNAELTAKDAIIKELKDTISSLQSTIDTLNANFENMRKELSTYKQ